MKADDGAEIGYYKIAPKSLDLSKKQPAYVYAHGGGGIVGEAKTDGEAVCCYSAVNLNCVVFNVEYRLGPEFKCPRGQMDFICCLKDVIKNQACVDTSKICIAGISGGGWIVGGASNILAKSGEANLVKAVFMHTGMLSDETGSIPDD